MTMITPSYLGETIEYSSLHACRSTLEDPTRGIQRRAGISAPHARSQPPEFLVCLAKQAIKRAPLLRGRFQAPGVELRWRIIQGRHDGFVRALAHC